MPLDNLDESATPGTADPAAATNQKRNQSDLNTPNRSPTGGSGRHPAEILRALGLAGGARAIQSFAPLRSAQIVMAAHKNRLNHLSLQEYVTDRFANLPVTDAPGWPVTALRGLSEDQARALDSIGIRTLADLSNLGSCTAQVIASGRADNGFAELPSAPAELLPTMIGAVSTSKRYNTFVREVDLTGLTLYVDEDCVSPLAVSGLMSGSPKHPYKSVQKKGIPPNFAEPVSLDQDQTESQDRPPSLADIFTGIPCPLISLGYLLDHRQDWINLGTYLGEIVHSISLAPGESRNIAMVNWSRRQKIARQEDSRIEERLTNSVVHNRVLEEVTGAVASEHQFGGTESETSTATTAASFVGAGAIVGAAALGLTGAVGGGVIGTIIEPGGGTAIGVAVGGAAGAAVGGVAGAAAGGLVYSGAQAFGRIRSSSEGDRAIIADVHQAITQSTVQNSSLERSVWSTVVVEDVQSEDVQAQTSNITNYNHMHTLNIEYYEVLQHYLTRMHLAQAEPVLYLPFTYMNFTNFTYIRDYWDIVREFIDDTGLRTQGDLFFVDEGEPPASPDLLAVPELPDSADATEPIRIEGLEIELRYESNLESDVTVSLLKSVGQNSWEKIDCSMRLQSDSSSGVYNRMTMYSFSNDDLDDVSQIKKVKVQTSAVNTAIPYEIKISAGSLIPPDGTTRPLKGLIFEDEFPQSGKMRSQEHEWIPSREYAPDEQEQPEFDDDNYSTIVDENLERTRAWEELQANFERFKCRLQNLVHRRRSYFTRIILNALEPQEIQALLQNLWIKSNDQPNGRIPLRLIAHVTPIGMTSSSFVMRLRRHDHRRQLEEFVDELEKLDPGLLALVNHAKSAADIENDAEEYAISEQVHLPTSGLFAEGLLGRANAAEYLDIQRYFNWQDSPIPHQAPALDPVSTSSRHQDINISPTDPGSNLNLVNAPQFPDSVGLAGVLAAIQNANIFRDMSKADSLTDTLGNLMNLSGQMGQTASQMTGEALQSALSSATEMGQSAANMTQQMLDQALNQAGGALKHMTQQGATLNAVKSDISSGPAQDAAILDTLGVGQTPAGGSTTNHPGTNPPSTSVPHRRQQWPRFVGCGQRYRAAGQRCRRRSPPGAQQCQPATRARLARHPSAACDTKFGTRSLSSQPVF